MDLKNAMKKKGLSTAQLARILGLDYSTIWLYRKNKRYCSVEIAMAIETALDGYVSWKSLVNPSRLKVLVNVRL